MKKIAIHSVPRSGSSWLGQIFNSSPDVNFKFQPLFSYAFKGYLNDKSSNEDINDFFKLIAKSNDSFLLQKDKIEQGLYPLFEKNLKLSHVVYKEVRYNHILENMMHVDPDVVVIGLVRSPYAVINSFLQAPREFRKDLGWNDIDEWRYSYKKNLNKREEFFGYEKWKETLLLFYQLKKRYPDKFYLIHYCDLLADTLQEVQNLFDFSGLDMTQQTKEFLIQSKSYHDQETYSVYKTKKIDTNWEESLNPNIIDEISNDLIESELTQFLIDKKR